VQYKIVNIFVYFSFILCNSCEFFKCVYCFDTYDWLSIITDVGYWIGGFGLGERIEERPALLSAIIVSATAVVV